MVTKEETESAVLYVKTFGEFSIWFNGKLICTDSKRRDSYFNKIMQILLHFRKEGIGRTQLMDILFEDADILDTSHMLRSIMYNARQKLKKAGLPDVNYFEQRDGTFFWNNEIDVVEDASEFAKYYEIAESENDPDLKLRYCMDACYKYNGEFIPAQMRLIWVAQEDRKYRNMFCRVMENAVTLLRMNKDYLQMETLGRHAMRTQPLSDWETVVMEGLVAMNRYDEAMHLYEETVDYYMNELGTRPSFGLNNLIDKMGEQMNHQYAVLDEIQMHLTGNNDEEKNYIFSYPIFQGIYRMVERMMERGGQSIYLMLCTIVDQDGVPLRDDKKLDSLSGKLGDAICHSVRLSDAICRYGKGQYLVLLINTSREDCNIVQKRINKIFLADRKRSRIKYYVNSVICSSLEPLRTEADDRS